MDQQDEVHWFWTESIWLPEGHTWKEYESTDTVTKAEFKELGLIPFFVLAMTGLRFLFERFIAHPLCVFMGIQDKSYERNKICELVYDTVTKFPKSKEYEAIAKETNMTTIEVNTWFRKRRGAKLQKVCDVLFGIFAVLFFLTRLIYYPCWVAYAFFHYNTEKNSIIFNSMVFLCYVLLFLNFFWGYLVLKLAYKVLISGKSAKDSRSDTEDSDNGED